MAKCGGKTKTCAQCKRRYKPRGTKCPECSKKFADPQTKCTRCDAQRDMGEYHLNACPACGFPRPCTINVAPGKKCRSHGGASKSGPDAPNYKSGIYSDSMPSRFRTRFEEYLSSQSRRDLEREIAIARILVDEKLRAFESGEAISASEGRKTFDALLIAMRRKSEDGIRQAIASLDEFFKRGVAEEQREEALRENLELVGKLLEKDLKREIGASQMISLQEFYLLMSRTLDAVERALKLPTEKERRAAVHREFDSIMTGEGSSRVN